MIDSNTGMQKEIVGIKLPVLAISVTSVLLVLVLTHHMPYSQNVNNDKNSFNNLSNIRPSTGRYAISSMSYQTFQDPTYGIKIQYPKDWEKIQFDKNFIVGFVSHARNDSGVLENLMISASRLSSPDISLDNFGKMRISALESQYPDFHLVSSGAFVTPTGSSLYKIEYDHKDGITPITTTELWSFEDKYEAHQKHISQSRKCICLVSSFLSSPLLSNSGTSYIMRTPPSTICFYSKVKHIVYLAILI